MRSLYVAIFKNELEEVKEIIDSGVDINTKFYRGRTALHIASSTYYTDILRYLVYKKANLNARENDSWTPLHLAADGNHLECVKILVEAGADVSLKTDGGQTAFDIARKWKYRSIVKYLNHSNSGLIGRKLRYDHNMLHISAIKGDEEILMIMIKRGIDINTKQEDDGWTALHLASYNGNFGCVKISVEAGADMSLKTDEGLTALELAEERGFNLIVEYLKFKQQYLIFGKFMKVYNS